VPATAPPAPAAGAAATSRTPISAAAQRAAVREMLHSGGGATEAWAAGALLAGVAVLAAWRLVCRRRSAAI
jgi:hypothetical protein